MNKFFFDIKGHATCLGCIYHMGLWIWCSNWETEKKENIIPSCQHLLIHANKTKKDICDPSCLERFSCFSLNFRDIFLDILYETNTKMKGSLHTYIYLIFSKWWRIYANVERIQYRMDSVFFYEMKVEIKYRLYHLKENVTAHSIVWWSSLNNKKNWLHASETQIPSHHYDLQMNFLCLFAK